MFDFGDIVKVVVNNNTDLCYGTVGIITNKYGGKYGIHTKDCIGTVSAHDIELIQKYDLMVANNYDKGLEDGWNLAADVYSKYILKDLTEIFNEKDAIKIIRTYTAKEAMKKIQEWKDNQIKNGDIVVWDDCKILVTCVDDMKIQGLCLRDMTIISTAKKNVKKVLKVNYKDQLEDLFDQIYNAVAGE